MIDDTAEKRETVRQAPGSVPLSDEDRRLLAALLDELLGSKTKDSRPTPQPHDVEPEDVECSYHEAAARA